MRLQQSADGVVVEAAGYRLSAGRHASTATLADPAGLAWAELRLLVGVDAIDGPDETSGISGPEVGLASEGAVLEWTLESSRWMAKRLVVECAEADLSVHVEVMGDGRLADVTFLTGRAALPDGASGTFWSAPRFSTLFTPAPSDPGSVVLPASQSTDISVAGGSEAGRGQWFFTPAPFWYAVSRAVADDPLVVRAGPWLSFGLMCPPGEQRFLGFGYRARDTGFGFVLDYEGHTQVAGRWSSPRLTIAPVDDPYAGLSAYRDRIVVTDPTPRTTPRWWLEPMFCGWGAQCAAASSDGLPMAAAPGYATEANYETWLAHLEARGVVPGTIVIDDKWQLTYGANEPDPTKWPDLRGWIADRHGRGQRVLLWWKAWHPEGLPGEWCVRTPDGRSIGVDPNHHAAREAIAGAVRRMLAPSELGADGIKIDFTARTPSGSSLRHEPGTWGVDLLRLLLQTVRDAAKEANPQSLLIGHVVEPSMATLIDMVRLNDLLRLDDPRQPASVVPQMAYRAAVVGAACPDHPIDTDDWCAIDLADWRRYAAHKPTIGVPALYYASHLDRTGETLEEADYALIRESWHAYRSAHGLRGPAPGR